MSQTNSINHIQGQFVAPRGTIAIVTAKFNDFVVDRLYQGCVEAFLRQGVKAEQLERITVPGAFEIPFICQQIAKSGRYQGIVTLGAVIRGATAHFEYVAGPCANQIASLQLTHNIPISFGVLTTENTEQAIERAGGKAGNKGAESAWVLMEMLNLMDKLNG